MKLKEISSLDKLLHEGLFLSWVYLKNNSYWSAVAAHAMWNFSLIYILPLIVNN